MKKLSVILIASLIFCFNFLSYVYAEDNIVEKPSINIIIDGQEEKYNDVPLLVNGRTMLPLREVLVNLGIQNDDEHIIWNNDEKSVTILTDSKNIYLEVGDNIAVVNGDVITLDVPPIIYSKNNRTYIPARFVAESLGKKVLWDGTTSSVLIVDEKQFNEVNDILTKSNLAMKQINKYKTKMVLDYTVTNEIEQNVSMDMDINIDKENNSLYYDMSMSMGDIQGVPFVFSGEVYQVSDITYMKSSFTGEQWLKSESSGDIIQDLEYTGINLISVSDIFCAGLSLENTDENIILLKGDVHIDQLFNEVMKYLDSDVSSNDVDISKYYVEFTIDKNTYEIKNTFLEFEATITDEYGIQSSINMKGNIEYSKFDDDFEIIVPDEVINTAVESD